MMAKRWLVWLLPLIIALGGCTSLRSPAGKGDYYLFPFENDLEGWAAKGVDLGKPPVTWSITRSGEMVKGGKSAVIFDLTNLNTQANIWLERSFPLEPGQRYRVQVAYDFASADRSGVNPWRLITGVAPAPFGGSDDLVYQGDTGNGPGSAAGYQWLGKAYDFVVQANADGHVYAAIGIRGNGEAQRHYFLDNVRITFTRDTPP
ncbi:MAG: hypothetical protein V1823_00830 [Chloroflexota bacterium]